MSKTSKIKALIIDDERLARMELQNLLKGYKHIDVIGECNNAESAITVIQSTKPDLLFLDIQMPGKSGFELLEGLDNVPQVIFTTAYDEYAIKAFEVSAIDYLLKPIDAERLDEAIKKATMRNEELIDMEDTDLTENETEDEEENNPEKQQILTEYDQVFVKDGDKCWFVKLKDIRLFESEGNYVRVYFDDNKPLILKSLNNLDEKLDNRRFFRANRKFIINLSWVERIENWFNGRLMVYMKNETEKIEISRRQATKLKNKMSL